MPLKRHPVATSPTVEPLDRLPLDTALRDRLRATYERVRGADERLAEVFYSKLFAAAPQLRPLFRGDPRAQRQKLIAALDVVVANLDKPQQNSKLLAELGQRHAGYGARPEHYDLVIDLLVGSMAEILGPGASPRALDEWRMALSLISRQMIAAATAAPAGTPASSREPAAS